MIVGVGLDIVERARIAERVDDQRFVSRVLTGEEQAIYQQLSAKRKIEYLSGRFSAKEAYAKARGTGIGAELSFQDICILDDEVGKPVIFVRQSMDRKQAHVSITHTRTAAAAVVIIEAAPDESAYS
ncbi:MAG: holo-ACP synthase [Sporolactobacillus sp.]